MGVWLANHGSRKLRTACGSIPDPLQRSLEAALTETWQVVRSCPPDIRIGEEEGGLTILLPAIVWQGGVAILVGIRSKDAFFGEHQIENDLRIQRPVTRVVENEDRVDLEGVGRIVVVYRARERTGGFVVVVGEDLVEGPDGGIFHENITWCHDIRKAVPDVVVSNIPYQQ